MAKRTIAGFKPIGFRQDPALAHDARFDALWKKVEPYARPTTCLALYDLKRDQFVDRIRPSRDALLKLVMAAAAKYRFEASMDDEPTNRQKATEFQRIAISARRLLINLQVGTDADIDTMPHALRYGGLQAAVASEMSSMEYSARGPTFPTTLLREAIDGIANIERWANAARQRCLADRRSVQRSGTALPNFVHSMMSHWWNITGKEPAEGRPLIDFISCAALIINVRLTEASARDRIRRALGRHGASGAPNFSELPDDARRLWFHLPGSDGNRSRTLKETRWNRSPRSASRGAKRPST